MADATVSLGLDPAQFEAGLSRAMQSAQGFGGRLGGVMAHPYAIAAAAAIGVGRAAAQARAESDALNLSVMKLTTFRGTSGLFRDAGDIDKEITTLTDKLAELREATNPTSLGGFVRKTLKSDAFFPGMQSTQDIENARNLKTTQIAIASSLNQQVEKQQALTELQRVGMDSSERDAAIQKAMLSYKERMGKIDEQYAGVPGGGEARNRLQSEAASQNTNELRAINRVFDLREATVALETKSALIRQKGLGDEAERADILQAQLEFLRGQLNLPGTAERAADLQSQISGAESGLFDIRRGRARQLTTARDATRQGQLAATGDQFGGKLNAILAQARNPIQEALRNRNPALAGEFFSQAQTSVTASLADELEKSPAQRRHEATAIRKRQLKLDNAAARMRDMEDRRSRGAYNQSGDEPAAKSGKTMGDLYDLMKRIWEDNSGGNE